MLEELFTVRELADYLKIPVATLYQWRYRGTGPRGIKVGRYVRYRSGEVERWLAEQTEGPG